MVWSSSELIKLVYNSVGIDRPIWKMIFQFSIFRLSMLPWANCHVFTKIIGMLKRRIIGSKQGFLRIFSNIFEGNSRLVFTQFRLFRWHLPSTYNGLFWTQHFVQVWIGSQAKGASDKLWLLEWIFCKFWELFTSNLIFIYFYDD